MKTRVTLAILVASLAAGALADAQTKPAAQARPAQGSTVRQVPASGQARRAGPAKPKEDVNRREPDGSTPLQWAVFRNDVAEVKRLLRVGAKAYEQHLAQKKTATKAPA